ncbi:MAG: glycyl-radical enzyme activating protein, partial [Clostridia bacterium]|nr:glycyl-radical enzyme activating protein [Clostridia bacterium]
MERITGNIINIKRFEIHDGDGLRTTLFLKGCPLRCKWCHNPESLSPKSELGYYEHKCISCGKCVTVCPAGAHSINEGLHNFDRNKCTACGKCAPVCLGDALIFYGENVTPEEVLPKLLADREFYETSGGGVTISGGEPLLQADFTGALLNLLKQDGINTAVDTCLFAPRERLEKVIPLTDTFLVDVKAYDRELHKKLTGQYNDIILENIRYLSDIGKPMEIRIPYVPGKNSGEIEKIAGFLSTLKSVKGVRVLPYHNLS